MIKQLAVVVLVAQLAPAYADSVLTARRADGLETARHIVVDEGTSADASPQARHTIYLNRNGITLSPGPDDSRIDRTSLVNDAVAIPPWQASEQLWAGTVSCLRAMYARYDVEVTDIDPGTTPHVEAVFGGSPALLSLGPRVAGVAPFSTGCRTIENAIVLTFTDVLPDVAQLACEVMAQEIAHSYGLDHELLAQDPMSYLAYDGARSFQDELVPCGEATPRACGLPGFAACRQMQNSVALLTERLGRAGASDRISPHVSITSPASGTALAAGFRVTADISDNVGIRAATLSLDGVVVDTLTSEPWVFTTPLDPMPGSYRLTVHATDGANESSDSIEIAVQAPDAGSPLAGCAAGRNDVSALLAIALAALRVRRSRSPNANRVG